MYLPVYSPEHHYDDNDDYYKVTTIITAFKLYTDAICIKFEWVVQF